MSTKFGYVERQATNNIDWSAIGSQVVQNLQEEALIRETKKDALDQASRDMATILRNNPVGENLTMNEFTLDYANNAQQLLLQQDRLLQAGILNPKDYAVVRANLNESTDELFNLSKEYQAEYESKMARLKNGESQELEAFLMASTEGLANLKNGKALIDPSTGVVSIGTWVDGKMDGDPSSYATVSEVRNRIKSYYDKYDTEFEIAESVKYLGGYEWVDVIKAQGGGDINQVITNMDPTQKAEYDAWENTVISSMMENKFNVTSMLTDNLDFTADGKAYGFTFNEEEFNRDKTGSLIFLDRSEDPNGVPVFKPEQEERVREMLRTNVRAQLDKEQDISISQRGYRPSSGGGTTTTSSSEVANMMSYLYGGTAEQIAQAEIYFKSLDESINNLTREPEGIVIEYNNGGKETIPLGIGTGADFVPFDYAGFVGSASPKLTGNANLATSILQAGTPTTYSPIAGKGAGATELPTPKPENDAQRRAAADRFLRTDPITRVLAQFIPTDDKERKEYLLQFYYDYEDKILGKPNEEEKEEKTTAPPAP